MKVTNDELVAALKNTLPPNLAADDIVFACIGSDRSTGDSLGHLVGTRLAEAGYQVVGTLEDTLHSNNLSERLKEIPEGKTIIGIDACLGQVSSVGLFQVGKGPIKPGEGVGKQLTPVGDYHIGGIVNVGGFMEYFVIQNTSLNKVMGMANHIVRAIQTVIAPAGALIEIAAAIEYPTDNRQVSTGIIKLKDIESFTDHRLSKALTLLQLAKQAGVKKSSLFRLLEGGTVFPNEAKKIAGVLAVRIIDMFVSDNDLEFLTNDLKLSDKDLRILDNGGEDRND